MPVNNNASKNHNARSGAIFRIQEDWVMVRLESGELITVNYQWVKEHINIRILPFDGVTGSNSNGISSHQESGWICDVSFKEDSTKGHATNIAPESLRDWSCAYYSKESYECVNIAKKILDSIEHIDSDPIEPLADNAQIVEPKPKPSVRRDTFWRLARVFMKVTLITTGLAVALCAVFLMLPLAKKTESVIPSAVVVQTKPATILTDTTIRTDGVLPEAQIKSIAALAPYAAISYRQNTTIGEQNTKDNNPISTDTFYLFSSLNCVDCGSIEQMIKNTPSLSMGLIMPMGIEQQKTIIGLSHAYCSVTPFSVWEQLRINSPDSMDAKTCEGWDKRAQTASYAEILITGTVTGGLEALDKPVLIAPNGAYHIGGFSDQTTGAQIVEWLAKNTASTPLIKIKE